MSESKSHMDLVAVVVIYVKKLLPDDLAVLVQSDSINSTRPTKAIKNYIPDVYYWHNDTLIIGEAKTINDFERQHSIDQFTAYLKECHNFYGCGKLVIGVPWQIISTAKNFFRKMKRDLKFEDVEIIVINELGVGGRI